MRICGLQKLSMVDYPEKIAATVFTGGCNLRCPFCHNALLVTRLEESPQLEEGEILSFLAKRRGLLDGVVLSGGEPLLQAGAANFLREIKTMGFACKLDTNGCFPETLSRILEEGLVDYVAMDIKNAPEQYAPTAGLPAFDLTLVQKSIDLLGASGVDYEYRTTLVREFHTLSGIARIGEWLQGAPRYYLQRFQDSGNLISPNLHGFSREEMESMADAARPFFGSVHIRGI